MFTAFPVQLRGLPDHLSGCGAGRQGAWRCRCGAIAQLMAGGEDHDSAN